MAGGGWVERIRLSLPGGLVSDHTEVLRSVVFLPVLDIKPQVNGSGANLPLCFLSLSEGPAGSDGPVPMTQMPF